MLAQHCPLGKRESFRILGKVSYVGNASILANVSFSSYSVACFNFTLMINCLNFYKLNTGSM